MVKKNVLSTTNKAMLALLKTALLQCPLELPEEINWQEVHREMQLHAVTSLMESVVPDIDDIDETLKLCWSIETVKTVRRFYQMLHEQQETMNMLQAKRL